MSETSKDYKQIEYENWVAKAKHCPLKLTTFRCLIHGVGICAIESCPIYYWIKT